mgnify:CR=1 FL=1
MYILYYKLFIYLNIYNRCEALQFKISKSQKKILKRMAKFLRNELHCDDTMDTYEGDYRDITGENLIC